MLYFYDKSCSDSETDLVASSSFFIEFIMEISSFPSSFFFEEVLSLSSICLKDKWLEAFRVGLKLFNTDNEADVILEPHV